MSDMVIELQTNFNIEDDSINSDLRLNEMDFSSDINEEFVIKNLIGTDDYEKLKNLPKINETTLIGNYNEIDPTVPTWAKGEEPEKMSFADIKSVWDSIFNN